MTIPFWAQGLISVVEEVDPNIAPELNLGESVAEDIENLKSAAATGFTLPPIPGSLAGVQGTWQGLSWVPNAPPPPAAQTT